MTLHGLHVVDRTTEIAGAYCTKILADAGADVVRTESAESDPLFWYRSGGLYEYLNADKRYLDGAVDDAMSEADIVITSDAGQARRLRAAHPRLVVVCITPFGIDGPWADRPATEFTLQAACGSTGSRGDPSDPPLAAGGRIGEWIAGTYAAVATIAAIGIDGPPRGRLVDVAMLDCMAVTLVTYPSVMASLAGWPPVAGTGRVIEVPSIEPTCDGFAVITTNSAQQFEDFLVMIGRSEWLADRGLARATERFTRRREFLDGVHHYTRGRSTEAVLEDAAAFRIPAASVLHGATVAEFEHFRTRGVFGPSATGRFRQPRPPYRITPTTDGVATRGDRTPAVAPDLPLTGIRVLDCTAWWAGPSATHVLACLGAEVIKVESDNRPDAMRTASVRPPTDPAWLEWSGIFHAVNAGKKSITLDLTSPEGVATFERLAMGADLVVENYTPRVMEQFGLDWERLHELNPRLVMVRMPAFGLDGPWRDRTGFAQTMESLAGMAWVTGFPDGPPVLVRGACDPIAGMHAVVATLLALRARTFDGAGRLVESTMVEAALNVTVEQVIEWDLRGVRLDREGNRGVGAPQDVYRCAGDDRWVAVAVVTDDQWKALRSVIGLPDDWRWETSEQRRAHADEIDSLIERWTSSLEAEAATAALIGAGVPAAEVARGCDIARNPQLRHRGLFEVEDHPVTGRHELPTLPFRFDHVETWLSGPAPLLGQHTAAILSESAGRTVPSHCRSPC